MDEGEPQEAVKSVVRDEYADTNHRDDFVRELKALGIDRKTLRDHELSQTTYWTAMNIILFARACEKRSVVYKLSALRFFAELLPAEEFRFFFNELFLRYGAAHSTSVFLWPHVKYDVAGGLEDGRKTHAAKYADEIRKVLKEDADVEEALAAIREAYEIRVGFYAQFN
jgi:hypothetical protein